MSKKENELRGGLNALLGGAVEKPSTGETEQGAATAPEEATANAEQQGNLLNEIEDTELREALRKRQMRGRGRPRKGCSSPEQTKDYTRMSAIVHRDKYAKIIEISLRESLQIKEVIEAAMDLAIETYEKKHGEIIPRLRNKGNKENLFK